MTSERRSESAEAWNRYWQTARDGIAYTNEERRHPVVFAACRAALTRVRASNASPRSLDIAAGNGALAEEIVATFGPDLPPVVCVDVADRAAVRLRARFGSRVRAVVADAARLPFANDTFGLVASLFGAEYAGIPAMLEAARVTSPSGFVVGLLHHRAGAIHRECAANLDALRRTHEAAFVARAERLLTTGFAAVAGADRAPYEAAGRALAPAIAALDELFAEHGPQVAGGTLARLYADIDRIHRSLPDYDAGEIMAWLRAMGAELEAYESRMRAMCEAALDEAAFTAIVGDLASRDFVVEKAEALRQPAEPMPLAWILVAKKKGRLAAAQ